MRNDSGPARQLPCEEQYETTSLSEEHALGYLVESTAPPGHGLHADHLVGFDSPTPRGVVPDHHDASRDRPGDVERGHDDLKTTSTTTPPTTLTTTTITKPVTETVVNAPAGPSATNAPHETNSSLGTVSSAKPVANAPAENASSGVLTGQLTPSFAVADVPLDGPGTWNVATSAASILTLRCANQSISVQAQFVIGAREQCQLILTPATTSTSLTWQLTPGN